MIVDFNSLGEIIRYNIRDVVNNLSFNSERSDWVIYELMNLIAAIVAICDTYPELKLIKDGIKLEFNHCDNLHHIEFYNDETVYLLKKSDGSMIVESDPNIDTLINGL